jgi:hypothetical protein
MPTFFIRFFTLSVIKVSFISRNINIYTWSSYEIFEARNRVAQTINQVREACLNRQTSPEWQVIYMLEELAHVGGKAIAIWISFELDF